MILEKKLSIFQFATTYQYYSYCQYMRSETVLTISPILLWASQQIIFNIDYYNAAMSDQMYYEGAAIAILVLNILSFISLLFVIVIYLLRWKLIASFPMRLSLYLCFSCLIQSLYVLMFPPMLVQQRSDNNLTNFCVFESMLKTAFDLSSIIWTSLIMYSTFASVVHGTMLERYELFYLALGYLLPILLSLVPIFLNQYGYNVYFCWFDSNVSSTQFGLKIGYFFAPLWVLFFLEIYWVSRTYVRLKMLGLESRDLNIFKRLLLFPFILLGTGIFATIDIIYNYATDGNFVQWLDIISLILLSSYGLCISLAYGFNPLLRDQVLELFRKKEEKVPRISLTESNSSARRSEQVAELITM